MVKQTLTLVVHLKIVFLWYIEIYFNSNLKAFTVAERNVSTFVSDVELWYYFNILL